MALKNRTEIKLNKNHGGKEFRNDFRFIGLVKPVRKKEQDEDSWFDVPYFQNTITSTKKQRRVLQFNIETANRNELKVELAGMEKDLAYIYSSKHKKSAPVAWDDRFDKSKYPDETYHYIEQEWDKTESISKYIVDGMWADVRGHYEFDVFENDDGDEIKLVKRIIDQVFPLKNGEVVIKGLKDGDEFRVFDGEKDGNQLGYGKADKEGVATLKVGWLNPKGGKLYLCKLDGGDEGERVAQEYNEGLTETERITIKNNIINDIQYGVNKDGKKQYIAYIRDFKHEDFFEVNSFEMQLAIKSTYQDENTKDTKVNAVYLNYGKEKSVPQDVELTVYYKEPVENKASIADAFSRLERLDFLVAEGIDNNRAEFAMVEIQETEDDNPFEDVGEKTTAYEQVSTGTKKGLEIVNYIGGTFKRGIITEEEISKESSSEDPFATVEIKDDDLPF